MVTTIVSADLNNL